MIPEGSEVVVIESGREGEPQAEFSGAVDESGSRAKQVIGPLAYRAPEYDVPNWLDTCENCGNEMSGPVNAASGGSGLFKSAGLINPYPPNNVISNPSTLLLVTFP